MLIKLCYTNPIKGDVVMLTKRNVVSSLVLSFVTCGIYYLYWLYKFDEDLKLELENDNNPLLDVILIFVTCGLYSVYLYYRKNKSKKYNYEILMLMFLRVSYYTCYFIYFIFGNIFFILFII